MFKDEGREFIRVTRRIETCAPALQAVAAVCLLYGPAQGWAQDAMPLGEVRVEEDRGPDAIAQAPTRASLSATQPTSVISGPFIQNNTPAQSVYGQIVGLAPNVLAIEQNGPGNAFSGQVSVRGFTDGQYNVTLDGIPFGDANNYTHHTSSYFMNRDLGQVSVDRGPGTASTVGNATLGGTIALQSKAPAVRTTLTPYASGGSFDTVLYGAQLDTGPLPGGGSAVFDGEHTSSDGALTFAGAKRTNLFAKGVAPLGPNTTITVLGMWNAADQYSARGASLAQIRAFGTNYGFSNDPKLQNYYKYNFNQSDSDFNYIGIKSQISDAWSVESKLYTYGYFLKGTRGIGCCPN